MSYDRPRSDFGNEGVEPYQRGYVPPSIENMERFAPADSLMWVCCHCDALNRSADGKCRRCGADNTEEVER